MEDDGQQQHDEVTARRDSERHADEDAVEQNPDFQQHALQEQFLPLLVGRHFWFGGTEFWVGELLGLLVFAVVCEFALHVGGVIVFDDSCAGVVSLLLLALDPVQVCGLRGHAGKVLPGAVAAAEFGAPVEGTGSLSGWRLGFGASWGSGWLGRMRLAELV